MRHQLCQGSVNSAGTKQTSHLGTGSHLQPLFSFSLLALFDREIPQLVGWGNKPAYAQLGSGGSSRGHLKQPTASLIPYCGTKQEGEHLKRTPCPTKGPTHVLRKETPAPLE